MEDAHITLSDLGAEASGMALFGVYDGHGGREVAVFCEQMLPDVVRRRISEICSSSGKACSSTATPSPSGGSAASSISERQLGRLLVQAYHEIDVMLRQPEHQKTLLKIKRDCPGAVDTGTTPQERLLSMARNSVKADLDKAQQQGSLSREEANRLMTKTVLMKRMEAQIQAMPRAPPETMASARTVGCTAVTVLLTPTHIVCANAGDSRAVLYRDGRAIALSQDHKPNDEKERRRILAAGGQINEAPHARGTQFRINGSLNLSRSIGDLEYKQRHDLPPEKQVVCATPDIVTMELKPQDSFLVIACDGVWDVKTNDEVCRFVVARLRAGLPMARVVEELLDDCMAADPKQTGGLGGDNMTCVIVRLTHSESQLGPEKPDSRDSHDQLRQPDESVALDTRRRWLCGLCSKA